MNPFKGDALNDLTSLQDRMNKLFTDSLKRLKEMSEPSKEKAWSPAVDIFELPETFVLLAEVPGIPKESISVELQNGTLIIKGERPQADGVAEGTLYRSERHYGPFERTFNLPVNVATGKIQARISDGILTIIMDKPVPEAKKVTVDID